MPRARLCQVEPPRRSRSGRRWRIVAASRPVLLRADEGEAGGGEHLLALGLGALGELVGGVALGEGGVDAVAEVHQELAALPRHDVVALDRGDGGGGEVGRDRGRRLVGAAGDPADVEDRRRRVAPGHDDAGLEVRGRQHHADGVRPGEEAQGRGLGRDAVGRADDGRVRPVRARAGRRGRRRPGGTSPPGSPRCRRSTRPRPRCRWPARRWCADRRPRRAPARPRGSPRGGHRGRRGSPGGRRGGGGHR